MIEHEIIEQIEEEPVGRSLNWCIDFATGLGCPDSIATISQMWRAGYLAMADRHGKSLPDWKIEQVMRAGGEHSDVFVLATDLGSKWAHG